MPASDGFEPTTERPYRQYLTTDDANARAAGRACCRAEEAAEAAKVYAAKGFRAWASLEWGHALDAAREASFAADRAEPDAPDPSAPARLVTKARGLARLASAFSADARDHAYRAGRPAAERTTG
jgi:hypothetical protein